MDTQATDILREGAPIQVVEQGISNHTERGKLIQALEANRLERWDHSEGESPQPDAPLWQVSEITLFIGGNRDRHAATLKADQGTYNTTKLGVWKPGTTSCW